MSDLEQLGIGLTYHRLGEDPERAATIRAALAGMSPEPGAGVVIHLPKPAPARLLTLSLHATASSDRTSSPAPACSMARLRW